jgi:hypothetical protein
MLLMEYFKIIFVFKLSEHISDVITKLLQNDALTVIIISY